MSTPKKEYPIIGFQWELLALIVGMWGKERFGIDVEKQLGRDGLEAVLDDEFCRVVARRFRQYWIKPAAVDPERQERVARLLVVVDEMVEELFRDSDDLQQEFRRRCAEAGCQLQDPATGKAPASATG
ncbi:MAG: hypothetical protein QNK18_15350 [Gammaproteobacteria bacterium]|nr:hypothetical protein [Gammaproteobacteria bacterium]